MLDTLLSQVICLHGFLWPNNCVAWYHHPHSIECFKGLVQSLTNKDLNSRPVRFQSLAPLLTTRHPPPAAAETLTSRTSLLSTPVLHVHVRPGRRCCTRRRKLRLREGRETVPGQILSSWCHRNKNPGVLASFPGQVGKKAGTRALELDRRGLNPSGPVCKL